MNYRIILTTVKSESVAMALADKLIAHKAAGCIEYLPVRSVYKWNGVVEHQTEFQLIIKTADIEYTRDVLSKIHPYKVPMIMELPVEYNAEFAQWLGS